MNAASPIQRSGSVARDTFAVCAASLLLVAMITGAVALDSDAIDARQAEPSLAPAQSASPAHFQPPRESSRRLLMS